MLQPFAKDSSGLAVTRRTINRTVKLLYFFGFAPTPSEQTPGRSARRHRESRRFLRIASIKIVRFFITDRSLRRSGTSLASKRAATAESSGQCNLKVAVQLKLHFRINGRDAALRKPGAARTRTCLQLPPFSSGCSPLANKYRINQPWNDLLVTQTPVLRIP